MKPGRQARIHQSCGSPGIYQEREWPFAADADVGDDRSPDDPYGHNRPGPGCGAQDFSNTGSWMPAPTGGATGAGGSLLVHPVKRATTVTTTSACRALSPALTARLPPPSSPLLAERKVHGSRPTRNSRGPRSIGGQRRPHLHSSSFALAVSGQRQSQFPARNGSPDETRPAAVAGEMLDAIRVVGGSDSQQAYGRA